MVALYVRNVPEDLYKALRNRARANRRSIPAEVLALLEEIVPTAQELKARQALVQKLKRICSKKPNARGSIPSTEEMLRQDRKR